MPGVEVGVLAAQTGCGIDHAFQPWQPIGKRGTSATAKGLLDASIDEPRATSFRPPLSSVSGVPGAAEFADCPYVGQSSLTERRS